MTPLAMVFMAVSVTSVVALAAWCYYRVLRAPHRSRPGEGRDPD